MNFAELFEQASQGTKEREPDILPEAAIARLREASQHYARPCQFKVGDLITPVQDSYVKGSGKPHLVIAILWNPEFRFDGDPGDVTYGARFDIRILSISPDGFMAPHWCESAGFQLYARSTL
jgi:hypothetical protein